MDLTIIIVNWNGGDLLQRCLRSIQESRTAFPVEVIVIDNDSADGSREAAMDAFPEYRIVNSGCNLGFGRANNLARSMVGTSHVLFLNPDTELSRDALQVAMDELSKRSDVGLLGCKMRYPSGEVQSQGLQWTLTPWTAMMELFLVTDATRRLLRRWLPVRDPNLSGYVPKLYGGFLLAPKDVIDRTGWFDDRYFMYAEDADLSRTVQALGYRLYYCSESEIVHVAGGTSVKAPSGFSILMKHESIHKLMRKYHGWLGAAFYRWAVFAGAAVRLVTLSVLCVFAVMGSDQRRRIVRAGVSKHQTMILWALGLRKAVVAGARGEAGQG